MRIALVLKYIRLAIVIDIANKIEVIVWSTVIAESVQKNRA